MIGAQDTSSVEKSFANRPETGGFLFKALFFIETLPPDKTRPDIVSKL